MVIHHVGYLVKNIEKAEADFILLGFQKEKETVYDSLRDAYISFWVNGAERVEFVSPASENSVVYNLLKKYKNMPYHICYSCKDIHKASEELRNNGFIMFRDEEEAVALDSRKVIFMMSAYSGIIELLEEVSE